MDEMMPTAPSPRRSPRTRQPRIFEQPVLEPPLPTFSLFSKLPAELQTQIWAFAACAVPSAKFQIQRMRLSRKRDPVDPSLHASFTIIRNPDIPSHNLLYTCASSREAFLKTHGYLSWPCASPATYKKEGKYTYIRKADDIFYFRGPKIVSSWLLENLECLVRVVRETSGCDCGCGISKNDLVDLDSLKGVQHIAFDVRAWCKPVKGDWERLLLLQTLFPGLTDVTVVMSDDGRLVNSSEGVLIWRAFRADHANGAKAVLFGRFEQCYENLPGKYPPNLHVEKPTPAELAEWTQEHTRSSGV